MRLETKRNWNKETKRSDEDEQPMGNSNFLYFLRLLADSFLARNGNRENNQRSFLGNRDGILVGYFSQYSAIYSTGLSARR